MMNKKKFWLIVVLVNDYSSYLKQPGYVILEANKKSHHHNTNDLNIIITYPKNHYTTTTRIMMCLLHKGIVLYCGGFGG